MPSQSLTLLAALACLLFAATAVQGQAVPLRVRALQEYQAKVNAGLINERGRRFGRIKPTIAAEVAATTDGGLTARGYYEEIENGVRVYKRQTRSARVQPASRTSTTTTTTAAPLVRSARTTSSTKPSTTSTTPTSTTTSTTTTTTTSTTTTTTSTTAKTTSTTTTTTTSSSVPVCAPTYTAPTMIRGTGTLPKPTTYVKRRASGGQGLVLDGLSFRLVGANIYWLCNDENVGAPIGQYPDKGRIREALAIAVAMGGNTIRIITCGTSVGNGFSHETSLGNFQSGAHWDTYDYLIYAAGQYGLRVILPLTDNYDYYHGGKYTFLRWLGLNTGAYGSLFYTDGNAINTYRQYINVVLTHRNTYNGLTWAQDPTIMMWETGNELGGYIGNDGYPPASWTNNIASYIKSLAPNQLVLDGTGGFYNYSTKATAPGLTVGNVNVVSDHGYPRNVALLNAQIPIATNANKAFIIGEFDWTGRGGQSTLSDYLGAIESTNYIGALIWNVMGHDAQCCQFVQHGDGYSLYYPNGNAEAADRANILTLTQFNYRVTGRAAPSVLPGVVCPQPAF